MDEELFRMLLFAEEDRTTVEEFIKLGYLITQLSHIENARRHLK